MGKKTVDRRTFLEQCALAGAGALLSPLAPLAYAAKSTTAPVTVSVVTGDKIFENTFAAVEALGGMGKFVKKGASVALLTNSVFDRAGTYVNPDVALAVVKMCVDAGASRIVALENTPGSYWRRGTASAKLGREIGMIRSSDGRKDVKIDRGKILKEATVAAELLTADVFVNIPIIKDHRGTRYTGNLKNMMGAASSSTCRQCHFGDRSFVTGLLQGYYSKPEVLCQSIADLNLVRPADLSVADATEILATNGPSGPGRIKKPMEVIAGTNAVAVDAYGVRHLDLKPEELMMIRQAQELGLGPSDLKQVTIISK